MRVTFFPGSIVGYVGYSAAILTRGLAAGLVQRGHVVRSVEARRNPAYTRTLRAVGSGAVRHFHDAFPEIQQHTYEPRSGAPLLEWASREVALIDVAVAVAGLDDELCRWLANISRGGLCRVYLTYDPDDVSERVAARLELARFDAVLCSRPPRARLQWACIPPAVARQDMEVGLLEPIEHLHHDLVDPPVAAAAFEAIVDTLAPRPRWQS